MDRRLEIGTGQDDTKVCAPSEHHPSVENRGVPIFKLQTSIFELRTPIFKLRPSIPAGTEALPLLLKNPLQSTPDSRKL